VVEISSGGVASVVSHGWDREGEVALYEDGCAPPLCPCIVSSGVCSESWGADGVVLWYSGVGGVL
jgi:hypothetical protein